MVCFSSFLSSSLYAGRLLSFFLAPPRNVAINLLPSLPPAGDDALRTAHSRPEARERFRSGRKLLSILPPLPPLTPYAFLHAIPLSLSLPSCPPACLSPFPYIPFPYLSFAFPAVPHHLPFTPSYSYSLTLSRPHSRRPSCPDVHGSEDRRLGLTWRPRRVGLPSLKREEGLCASPGAYPSIDFQYQRKTLCL